MYAVWKIKNMLICAALAAVLIVAASAAGMPDEGVKLPIIMYHSVLRDTSRTGKYIITPQSIEEDLKYLAGHGYKSVTAGEVMAYVENGTPLPPKPYMLTFDDGCYNNLTYVLPLLEKYDAYAVVSVVGSYSKNYSDTGEASAAYGYLRWQDISELAASGRIEIGNHSYDMHSVGAGRIGAQRYKGEPSEEYRQKFAADCEQTQEILRERCGISPVIYTYPFGAYCDVSQEILKNKGFKMILTCNEHINNITRDAESLQLLGRFNRSGRVDTYSFFKKCKIF